MLVKKGGNIHKKVGIWYVYTMSVVALSAFILSVENLFTDRVTMGIFLGFLSLVTARPLWLGLEVLKSKTSLTKRFRILHMSTSVVLALLGLGLLYVGLTSSNSLAPVMIIFGILGLTAILDIVTLLKSEYSARSKQWLKDHISNMFVGGIAAHTAFLVFGGQSILPNFQAPMISVILWTSPSVIGLICIYFAKKKYAKSKDATVL